MRRAHERNAATEGKFFFRTQVDYRPKEFDDSVDETLLEKGAREGVDDASNSSGGGSQRRGRHSLCNDDSQDFTLEEMTVLEIMEGKV